MTDTLSPRSPTTYDSYAELKILPYLWVIAHKYGFELRTNICSIPQKDFVLIGNKRRINIEVDGRAYHSADADLERDSKVINQGYEVMRIRASDIINRPKKTMEEVEWAIKCTMDGGFRNVSHIRPRNKRPRASQEEMMVMDNEDYEREIERQMDEEWREMLEEYLHSVKPREVLE